MSPTTTIILAATILVVAVWVYNTDPGEDGTLFSEDNLVLATKILSLIGLLLLSMWILTVPNI